MASDTVPAAAGEPAPVPAPPPNAPTTGTAPGTGGPGGLAGLLAAVEPARPTGFTLDPTTLTADADASGVLPAGASSDAFHTTSDPQNGPGTPTAAGAARQDTGVIRAWLLAGAERWRKGADARNKALDIKKEKAKALQVKESRTTSVNRSEKMVGGTTNSGTNTQAKTDKNTASKTSNNSGSSGGAGRGPRPGPGTSSNGSHNAGRTNGGRGPAGSQHGSGSGSGGRGTGGGTGGSGGAGGGRNTTPDAPRRKKDHPDTNSGSHNNSNGGQGGGRRDRNNSPSSTSTRNDGGHGSSTNSSKRPRTSDSTTTSTCGDASGIDKKPHTKPTPTHAGDKQGTTKPDKGKANKPKVVIETEGTENDGPSKPGPPPAAGATEKNTPRPGGPTINTQDAREAGYRDGTRIGRVEAHVGAYRDGVRDGRADIKDAAAREKDRLDKAHAAQKNPPAPQPTGPVAPPKPTHPPRPTEPPTNGQPAPQPAGTEDPAHTKPSTKSAPVSLIKDAPAPRTDQDAKDTTVPPATAQPIQVTGINSGYVDLGNGADRGRISTGEVRTLKALERKLNNKAGIMLQVYSAGCEIKAHANEQLKRITWWVEQAKVVDGGDDLIATLVQLEEAAQIQVQKAEEICRRAARSNDSCRALLANVEVRYGSIYQAVVDANRDKPAVMSYYRESADA